MQLPSSTRRLFWAAGLLLTACDGSGNPRQFIEVAPPRAPTSGVRPAMNAPNRGCPAGSPTWMQLPVCEESARVGYDRDEFGMDYESLEDEIIARLPRLGATQVYTPYTCQLDEIRPDGTAATDIDHIAALAEAYDSGLSASRFRNSAATSRTWRLPSPS